MSAAVLHIASLPGGGVDRHLRDIARSGTRPHLFWHCTPSAGVVEDPRVRRCFALSPAALDGGARALAEFLRARGVGLVHAHSVAPHCRIRAAWACDALAVPLVATLHDVLFLREDGFAPGSGVEPDPAWLAATRAFLATAVARIAPSDYLARLAMRHLDGQAVEVVPNGSPSRELRAVAPDRAFVPGDARHVVAVVGAIGPHKGSRVLEEVAARLEGSGIVLVVIGYLDDRLVPGWRGRSLFVHGAWHDADTAGLLAAYGARLVLFPNRVPESFSYTLSDAWDAGVPVLVPDEGALGERVRRHGGGWLMPAGADAPAIAEALHDVLDGARSGERAQVESRLRAGDAARVPPVAAMTRSLDAFYQRFGIETGRAPDPSAAPAQELLARNLDGSLFRVELVRLADEMRQVTEALEAERTRHAGEAAEARAWIAKLEADVAALQAEVGTRVEAARQLEAENLQMRAALRAWDRLPPLLRRALARWGRDARG